mgnify:CR=1 FL=1
MQFSILVSVHEYIGLFFLRDINTVKDNNELFVIGAFVISTEYVVLCCISHYAAR